MAAKEHRYQIFWSVLGLFFFIFPVPFALTDWLVRFGYEQPWATVLGFLALPGIMGGLVSLGMALIYLASIDRLKLIIGCILQLQIAIGVVIAFTAAVISVLWLVGY